MNPIGQLLCLMVRLYQKVVSPCLVAVFGPMGCGCRFTPTCSAYAIEAITTRGLGAGSLLAVGRVCRCHPWGGSGHDPVPPSKHPTFNPSATR